jgi:hypothetical protein
VVFFADLEDTLHVMSLKVLEEKDDRSSGNAFRALQFAVNSAEDVPAPVLRQFRRRYFPGGNGRAFFLQRGLGIPEWFIQKDGVSDRYLEIILPDGVSKVLLEGPDGWSAPAAGIYYLHKRD